MSFSLFYVIKKPIGKHRAHAPAARSISRACGASLLSSALLLGGMTFVAPTAYAAPAVAPAGIPATAPADPTEEVCLDANELTMLQMVDLVAEQLAAKADAHTLKVQTTQLKALLRQSRVAYVHVSTPQTQLNKQAADVNDPLVTYIAGTLLKVRAGEAAQEISVGQVTVAQAVETLLLGMRIVGIPVKLIGDSMPSIMALPGADSVDLAPVGSAGKNLTDLPLIGTYFTVGGVASLPLSYGPSIILAIAKAIRDAVEDNDCLGKAVKDDNAGKPVEGSRAAVAISPEMRNIANKVDLAGDKCRPLGDVPLGIAVDRQVAEMRPKVAKQDLKQFDANVAAVKHRLNTGYIDKALVPLRSEDIGGLIAFLDNPVATTGFSIVASLVDGRQGQYIPLKDLTVRNATDYIMLVNAIVSMIASPVWGAIIGSAGPVAAFVPSPVPLLMAPTTIGLQLTRDTMRVMCDVQDQQAQPVQAVN